MAVTTRRSRTSKTATAGKVSGRQYTGDFEQGLVYFLPNLKAFACSLTRDISRAEDLVQDTVLRALSNQEKFIRGSNLLAWLFTILRNLFLSDMRRSKSFSEIVPQLQARDRSSVANGQHSYMQLVELLDAVDGLPPQQRRAVTLVGAFGYSYEETADREDCAVGTVKSRVSRARSTLTDLTDTEII